MILVSLVCMKVLVHKGQGKGQNGLVEDHDSSKTCAATFSSSDTKPQEHKSNSEAKISASRALSRYHDILESWPISQCLFEALVPRLRMVSQP